jgi:hypothetical protein
VINQFYDSILSQQQLGSAIHKKSARKPDSDTHRDHLVTVNVPLQRLPHSRPDWGLKKHVMEHQEQGLQKQQLHQAEPPLRGSLPTSDVAPEASSGKQHVFKAATRKRVRFAVG